MIKKIGILALLGGAILGFAAQASADVYPLNKSPFRVWNSPFHADSPFAPHNGFYKESPFKPWNSPFGSHNDLNLEERRSYGLDVW